MRSWIRCLGGSACEFWPLPGGQHTSLRSLPHCGALCKHGRALPRHDLARHHDLGGGALGARLRRRAHWWGLPGSHLGQLPRAGRGLLSILMPGLHHEPRARCGLRLSHRDGRSSDHRDLGATAGGTHHAAHGLGHCNASFGNASMLDHFGSACGAGTSGPRGSGNTRGPFSQNSPSRGEGRCHSSHGGTFLVECFEIEEC
jgi:hypothetical protein